MDTDLNNHVITPGPYRATKLWNEVTKLFRAGMPLRKHRQHFRVYGNCFTAGAAVDWLHELLRNNNNFGPEVTRQQTVQLLKKFLKNHVIEDVKARWGTEEFEDNAQLYRFPSSSPLKPIPNYPPALKKKSGSLKEKEGFFKFRTLKKFDKETLENIDPENQELSSESVPQETVNRREVTVGDAQEVWRNITLTHLQKILGLGSLEDVLDPTQVSSEHIVYNVTHVNKHGVVTLEDKTDDLPHWVLSAMKCLANWPKSDSSQPSYPGFERDVFKTVSDYFCSLSEPLLTFQYYELFVNVLVLCGYISGPKAHRGKRKNPEAPHCPKPSKTPHINAATFKSTECLLLSLIRKGGYREEDEDQDESPMREVFSSKVQSRSAALRGGCAGKVQAARRASAGDLLGGSCLDLPAAAAPHTMRRRPQSFSLEAMAKPVVSDGAPGQRRSQRILFRSEENLLSSMSDSSSSSGKFIQLPQGDTPDTPPGGVLRVGHQVSASMASLFRRSSNSNSSSSPAISVTDTDSESCSLPSSHSSNSYTVNHRPSLHTGPLARPARPRSLGNLIDIAEHREESGSCFSIHAPVAEITMRPDFTSTVDLRGPSMRTSTVDLRGPSMRTSTVDLRGPSMRTSTVDLRAPSMRSLSGSSLDVRPGLCKNRRCQSSVDLFRPPVASAATTTATAAVTVSAATAVPPHSRRLGPDQTLLQPQLERVAIEALQLCTLLLPPCSRRKLQLLMRMVSRMAQNVDMPRLHHAIGTRTLMVHTFSQCVLSCQEVEDLDELLASRLLSFLIDHHQEILQVPVYLQNAARDHIAYLNKVQLMCPGTGPGMPAFSFCRQISAQEFEEQRLSVSQAAIADLLESIIRDKAMSVKEKKKKLKMFQKEYPDIYTRRFPTTASEAQLFADKPKIKPPMLLGIKTKTFSIRN